MSDEETLRGIGNRLIASYAHEEARDVELGRICSHCSEPFLRANGFPAACSFCFRKLSPEEQQSTPLSEHPESTATFFANRARARRKSKQEQEAND